MKILVRKIMVTETEVDIPDTPINHRNVYENEMAYKLLNEAIRKYVNTNGRIRNIMEGKAPSTIRETIADDWEVKYVFMRKEYGTETSAS